MTNSTRERLNGGLDPVDVRRNLVVQPRPLETVLRASYPPTADSRQSPPSTVRLKAQHRAACELLLLKKLVEI